MPFHLQLAAVVLAVSSMVMPQKPPVGELSQVPREFQQLYDYPPPRNLDSIAAGLPCDFISMEYVSLGGSGIDAGYTLTLNKTLHAELHRNSALGSRLGETGTNLNFSGNVSLPDFGKLCQMARQPAFAAIHSAYVNGAADGFQVTVTIRSGETTRKITERNAWGPIELWAFEQSMEAVAHRIRWVPGENTPK